MSIATPSRKRRLEQLFLDAVENPDGPARDARLRAACGDDAALLDDVHQLLAADETNEDGLLARPIAPISDAVDDEGDSGDEDVPATIGGYDVLRYIDGGSIGTVYEARHGATGRRAAVKLIRVGLATARQRARFQIEAELLARLSDPGIARLYDAGEALVTYPDGQKARRVFIAMEFVDGPDVVAHCRAEQPPLARRVELMVGAARAVQHAHERGVVHRDLKPSHILVGRGDGRPRVVDFGIATVADPDARMTVTGAVLGTPAYMSPEQRAGRRDLIGPPTDVYSLAAVFYEVLAGRPVVEFGALRFGIDTLPEPRRLRLVAADVPRDLDAVIHKALSTDPADRYPTARDLADDLQRWADLLPVRARPPSAWDRVRLQARRRPRLVTAVAVAVVAGVTLGSVAEWQAVRARRAERAVRAELVMVDREEARADRQRAAAEQEKVRADHQAKVSAAVARFLSEQIIGRNGIGGQMRDTGGATPNLTLRDALDRAVAGLTVSSFDGDAETEVAVRRAIACAYLNLGQYDAAAVQFEKVQAVLRQAGGADSAEMLDLESKMGLALTLAHRSGDAMSVLQRAYADDVATLGGSAPDTVIALDRLATALVTGSGATDDAIRLARLAVDLTRQVFGAENHRTMVQMWTLAVVLRDRGDAAGSRAVVDELLRIGPATLDRYRQTPGPDRPETIQVEMALATAYDELGQYDRGLPLLRDVLARRVRLLGPDHHKTFDATTRLVMALHAAKQDDELIKLVEPEFARNLRLHGPDDPDTLTSMSWKVAALIGQGHPGQAEPIARELVERAERRRFQSTFLPQAYIDQLNRCLSDQGKPPYQSPTTAPTTRASR